MESLKKLLPAVIRERLDKFAACPAKHIFYRIIDVDLFMKKYTLQCVNTRSIFYANLDNIISDKNIIYRLHPIQACYLGMEYAKKLKKNELTVQPNYPDTNDPLHIPRGIYHLCYQDRKNNLCFIKYKTKEEFIMDPRDIVLAEPLIEGFNTVQAFHIGFLAGVKINDAAEKNYCQSHERLRRPHLWLVK